MKNKDLNTYINDKLGEGGGLPYKEEYWSSMNELLDTKMPAQSTAAPHASTVTTTKAVSGTLKLIYLSSICAAVFTVSFMYTRLFAPETLTKAENNTPTQTTETVAPETPSIPSSEVETTTKQETLPIIGKSEVGNSPVSPTPESTSGSEHLATPANTSDFSQSNTASSILKNSTVASSTESSGPAATNAGQSFKSFATPGSATEPSTTVSVAPSIPALSSSEESGFNRTIDFSYINPIEHVVGLNTILAEVPAQIPLIAYPKRNRLISHITLSPFVSYVSEYDQQTYRIQGVTYTHAAQSNLAYGLNVECSTKSLALRSGIGWSQTAMLTNFANTRNVYKVDTNYVVIQSNYDTTVSGKPVALVQRRIDSSIVGSETSSVEKRTTYQYLTIPLTLQYRVTYKRLTVVLEGGALHHFIIAQQTQTPIQQANSENRFPVKGYHLQLTAGSGLRYALSSRWALGLQYNYNLNPSSANLHFLNNAHVATLMLTRTIR